MSNSEVNKGDFHEELKVFAWVIKSPRMKPENPGGENQACFTGSLVRDFQK